LSGPCKAVTCKGKIYVASTNDNNRIIIEEYDPITDIWSLKKATSHMDNAGEFCVAATDAGIFIMGGYWDGTSLNNMEKYEIERDTFLTLGNMPIGLDCASAVSVDNLIYIMVGRSKADTSLSNRVFAYDPDHAAWSAKQAAPRGRVEAHVAVLNKKIYLFGGYISGNNSGNIDKCDNRIDIYDPVADTWTEGEIDFAEGKTPIGMGVIHNEIYFVAATFGNKGPSSEEVFKYNPASKSAVRLANHSKLTWLMGTVSLHDSIYFIGGIQGEFPAGERENSTLLLRLGTNAHSPIKNL
jgi:N-acetylneuraminic acid mutarotase